MMGVLIFIKYLHIQSILESIECVASLGLYFPALCSISGYSLLRFLAPLKVWGIKAKFQQKGFLLEANLKKSLTPASQTVP